MELYKCWQVLCFTMTMCPTVPIVVQILCKIYFSKVELSMILLKIKPPPAGYSNFGKSHFPKSSIRHGCRFL